MILFDEVTHYVTLNKPPILEDVSLALPTDRRIAFLGLRGSGRSTVLRLINGMATPRRGAVIRPPGVSSVLGGPPVAVSPKLTVQQYVQDIARIYGAVFEDVIDFMVEWGEVDPLLNRLFSKLTNVEKSRVMMPLIYGLPFSFYLVDGDPGGNSGNHRERFLELFRHRIAETGVLYASPKPQIAATYCDAGLVLDQGQLLYFDALTDAMAYYEEQLAPLETPEDPEEVERLQIANRARDDEEAPAAGFFF